MRKLIPCLFLLAAGCGGDEGVNLTVDGGEAGPPGNDATVDSSPGTDANGGTDSATSDASSTDGAVNVDAGIPPNGTPPDPGKVACGSASCTVAQSCCVSATADGGVASTCGGNCNAGAQLECDEAKDCPPAVLPDGGTAPQVCCYERAGNAIVGASCHRDCTGGGGTRVQACRTSGECLTGSCAVRTCTGTIKSVETCGPIANVCP